MIQEKLGGKARAFPIEISKLPAEVITTSVDPLGQEKNLNFIMIVGAIDRNINFSNSLIIHAFTSQSGFANLVRCVWFETPMKHWTEAFPR